MKNILHVEVVITGLIIERAPVTRRPCEGTRPRQSLMRYKLLTYTFGSAFPTAIWTYSFYSKLSTLLKKLQIFTICKMILLLRYYLFIQPKWLPWMAIGCYDDDAIISWSKEADSKLYLSILTGF